MANKALPAEFFGVVDAPGRASDVGPKEYWRSKMVGRYTYGQDGHPMTEKDFEEHWPEDR